MRLEGGIMRSRRLFVALGVALVLALAACGGGGNSSSTTNGGTDTSTGGTDTTGGGGQTSTTTVTFIGKLDGISVAAAPKGPRIIPKTAAIVDRALAVTASHNVAEAVITGDNLSFTLDKLSYYLIVLLHQNSVVGIYLPDQLSGLDCLPLTGGATNIDAGALTLRQDGRVTHSIDQATLLGGVGMSSTAASLLGSMDNGFLSLSSLDVDGNNVLDFLESKTFSLLLIYEFRGSAFAAAKAGWSDMGALTIDTYRFTGGIPSTMNLDWSAATLTAPQAINAQTTVAVSTYTESLGTDASMMLNFFFGGYTDNLVPPQGTYRIDIGTRAFTFNNLTGVPIDSGLNNLFAPKVRLTADGGGMITNIEWQWHHNSGGTWTAITDGEMDTVFAPLIDYELNSSTGSVTGTLPHTASGGITPVTQGFVPTRLTLVFGTTDGYKYSFIFSDW